MQDFPHHYRAIATHRGTFVDVVSPGLSPLETAGPAEFDGPGDRWSPETLFSAAIANCFVLTFKGVARASKFDRIDRVNRFTDATLNVTVTIEDPTKRDQAERILRKSEENCLITNSLTTKVKMVPFVATRELAANG